MARELLINAGVREVRTALLAEGVVTDVIIEPRRRWSLIANVYLGRVARVVPAIDAAFVELGLEKAGFLGAAQASPRRRRAEGTDDPVPGIAEQVHEGEAVLVQVSNDPIGDKGPKLTADIALPGRYLVHTPFQDGVALSRRIEDASERDRLESLVGESIARHGLTGVIVRTAAEGASGDDIDGEMALFAEQWAGLMDKRAQSQAPVLLHRDLDPVSRALRDFLVGDVEQVLIDTNEGLNAAKDYCATFAPDLADRLSRHQAPPSLFEAHGVEAAIEAALEPRVELASGGSIYIESTEALTAIDVNTGRFTDARNAGDAARKTNLEAATEIARQLRLRAIGGVIVIDFIHMTGPDDAADVTARLESALTTDKAPARIGPMSEFGLVEMTRKRVRTPLAEFFGESCDRCEGSGRRWGAAAMASEILRRAEAEGAREPSPGLAIVAATDVVAELKVADGADLVLLGQRLGKSVEVSVDPSFAREQYDIVPV